MIDTLDKIVGYQVHVRQVQMRVSDQVRVLPLNLEADSYLEILVGVVFLRRACIVIHQSLQYLFLVCLLLLSLDVQDAA